MKLSKDILLDEFKRSGKDNFNIEAETNHVMALITEPEIEALLANYEYIKFIRAGGSGMVFEIRDRLSQMHRAMKLSRVNSAVEQSDPKNPVNIDFEIHALSMVSHQHITRFYDAKTTHARHYCIITQLVEQPLSLDEWVVRSLDEIRPLSKSGANTERSGHSEMGLEHKLHNNLLQLSEMLIGYADALHYMHESLQLYHMDIKPGNLLLGQDNNGIVLDGNLKGAEHNTNAMRKFVPYVTDLGFARWRPRYEATDDVPVGFTFGFNHPRLTQKKFLVQTTLAKAAVPLPATELDQRFDLYAFGRTILCILKLYKDRFGLRVTGNYAFLYLHLLATLLLDAKNTTTAPEEEMKSQFLSEVTLGIDGNLLTSFKITSFSKVVDRLKRLLGNRPIEYIVPELNQWHSKTINHGAGYLVVSPRITSLMNHPAFRRLRDFTQLGVVSEIYSGATHSRFAHTLGVTGTVAKCLCGLYNDPENPIFKMLVEDKDVKTMIVAAMVHDLGQSEFGHELEEIDGCYSHNKITQLILSLDVPRDHCGRTIGDIVRGVDFDEWGIDYKELSSIVDRSKEWEEEKEDEGTNLQLGLGKALPKYVLFQDLLDGPIDADKIDYLRRDGINCNVPYGQGIDVDRFFRAITVLPVQRKTEKLLRLGIREKGLASSESIAFARQKMYQAVYLHHAARALKATILTACAQAHTSLRSEITGALDRPINKMEEATSHVITELFTCHLLSENPALKYLNEKEQRHISKTWKKICNGHERCIKEGFSIDRSISFFYWTFSDESKLLLNAFVRRQLYKRLWEMPFAALSEDQLERLKKKFSLSSRATTVGKIANRLMELVQLALKNQSALAESLNVNPESVLATLDWSPVLLIVDLPLRPIGGGGTPPPMLRDINRKSGDISYQEGVGHIWKEGMEKMMREISMFRIFCEPRFFEILTATNELSTIETEIDKQVGLAQ